MNRFLVLIVVFLLGCVEQMEPIKEHINNQNIEKTTEPGPSLYPGKLRAKAAIISSVKVSGDGYLLSFSQPSESLAPAGGHDTLVNGKDLNDSRVGIADHNWDHDNDGYTNLEEFLHYRA